MSKFFVGFDTIEQAAAAHAAVYGHAAPAAAPAPAPAYAPAPAAAPAPAPAPVYAPAPAVHVPQPAAVAPVAAPAPAPAPATSVAPTAAPAAGGLSAKDVGVAAQGYSKRYGPKAAKALLAQFGLTQLNTATPDQYPALHAALSA